MRTAAGRVEFSEAGRGTSPKEVLDLRLAIVQNRNVEAKKQRAALRGALYRADGPAVVALAAEFLRRADALQLFGDGLLAAIDQRVEGAEAVGSVCAAMLRQRGWDGDELLADHLEGTIGSGSVPMLRPLAVDLEALASILEGDPVYGGGRIDRWTGEVWPQTAIEYAVETGDEDEDESDNSDRWLRVECQGSVEAFRDMELFVDTVGDARTADRLAAAIGGRGAFRRFKDTLSAWPAETHRWYAYSEERQRGRAREWLAENGYYASAPSESRHPAATNDPCSTRRSGTGANPFEFVQYV